MLKNIILLLIATTLLFTNVKSQNPEKDSLTHLLTKAREDTNKVNLLREIGISVIYQNPPEAIPYFKQAIQLAKKLKFTPGLERNYAATSTAFAFTAQMDSALAYIDTAIQYARVVGDVSRLALVYLNRADAYQNLHNYAAALRNCDTALKYAEQSQNKDRLARIYDIMSDVYRAQQQYPIALNYLDKALALYRQMGNLQMSALAFFNKSNIYRKTNKKDSAILLLKDAIRIADSIRDIQNLSAYNGELAGIYIEQKKITEAVPLAAVALEYAEQTGNRLQQAVIHDLFYNLYLAQNDIPKAIQSGLKAYAIVKEEKDILREPEVTANLAYAYYKLGNTKEAYHFLKISKDLNDSLVRQQFNDETAKLQTTFQVAQKDKEIQLLNKDKELQQQKLTQQRLLLIAAVVLAVLAFSGIFLLINRNRLRQQMKELELRNRIAADLHDEVGSSLSSIHMLSQMATQKQEMDESQRSILSKVSSNAKETMEKMGDIVWMIKSGETEGSDLKQRMERFAYETGSSKNIDMLIQLDEIENVKLSMEKRKNIYLIFKEAVNNAVKYSGAEKIEIAAAIENKELMLRVKDNGKGFEPSTTGRGNGLDNMRNRAKDLNGKLIIDAAPGMGTAILLSVPI